MKARKSLKFLAVAMTFAVVLAGCEELLGGITDFGLDEYIDNLEEGELTVTVTGLDGTDFDRADVWVEPFDIDEIDISLDDLDDDDAVEAEVENWVDDHDAPDSFPDDIYAGYGEELTDDDEVSDQVKQGAEIDDNGITDGDDRVLDGNIYVVYVVLTDENNGNGSAEIGVTFAIVDGDSSVSIAYDEGEFEEFTIAD